MNKKDKIETAELDDMNLVPELLDGKHRVIPIVTGGDEVLEEVNVPEILPILTLRNRSRTVTPPLTRLRFPPTAAPHC